ncbi:Serine/threonine protein kinase [Lentzea fradiae]|uniref:non-specific serine/threonine protein kinase n=1 Tax=Lentzea fradiae TaxID=200378 RepID=A0A1G7PSJ2_9PSEU|nr:serine/threonine-protein kinase [Lentzea fradiae]SDF69092.1 Serine/threonine protein kinase [Lentzea fradiae]SDF88370.1 Serine/threonine protein kinase [Lentzea fradiae]
MTAPHIPGLSDLRPLGAGGFATVYRAHQAQLHRDVAVKIDNRVLVDERDRHRFLREARAAAKLSGHPHVVGVHDANITPWGTPYIVMELCTGGSLADQLDRQGPLHPERVRELGIRLADALATAHSEGVLHRDIKPGNILVDRYGTPKLADFGLAALLDAQGGSTVTRDALSPSYAPPEAFAMAEPTPQADVYSLAATLYTLLAGKPPRPVPWPVSSFDQLGEILRRPVTAVDGVPPALHEALARALHPDANLRTASAAQLRDELSDPMRQPTVPVGAQVKRTRWPVLAAAAGVVVALAAGVVAWNSFGDEKAAAQGPGAATTTTAQPGGAEDVPPFLKKCDGGFCIDKSTCFRGINSIGGEAATARKVGSCADEHYWEAFGGGWLSGEIPAVDSDELAASAEVKGVCTTEAMKANTRASVDTTGWEITAVGFKDGTRSYFLCLASEPGVGEVVTSAFGSS